jgi:hypothetical protein
VGGSGLIGTKLNDSGLSPFLDNIPYRGVIPKQRQHRLAILVKGRALVKTGGGAGWKVIQKTRESLVRATRPGSLCQLKNYH